MRLPHRQTRMLRVALLAALFAFPSLVHAGTKTTVVKADERTDAIDFELTDLDGKAVKLSQYEGKVVVLDFWASWCKPCKKELPALETLAKQWKKDGKDVVVLGVTIDKDKAKAQKFLTSSKIKNVVVAHDPEGKSAAKSYSLPTMPTSFVIDKQGRIAATHVGYHDGDEKKISADVEAVLGE